jgi:hypothetical protein
MVEEDDQSATVTTEVEGRPSLYDSSMLLETFQLKPFHPPRTYFIMFFYRSGFTTLPPAPLLEQSAEVH